MVVSVRWLVVANVGSVCPPTLLITFLYTIHDAGQLLMTYKAKH